jgi:hypothetical protein
MSHSCVRAGGIVPIVATAALTQGQLVKIVGGEVVVATASDTPVGAVTEAVEAGQVASVALIGAVGGTVYLEAHDASITVGETLKPAAAGRVDGGATGLIVAMALEASTAQGDLIECALLTPVTKS